MLSSHIPPLASLQRGKKLVACEWHVEDPCPDRVVDRIDDGRRGRTHRGLAQAVRAECAVGLGLLDDADLGERRVLDGQRRSEERRVGKEWRAGWGADGG